MANLDIVELSLHEAIRSGDTAARMIYSDWLEDHKRGKEAALLRSGRWCLIPAGTFWEGGHSGKAGKERGLIGSILNIPIWIDSPSVKIPYAFYLGAFQVTQGEWRDVMGNNPSHFSREGMGKDKVQDISHEDLDNFPVETVSWDDAQEYIQKLNEQKPVSGFLYRLPTDVEWEYASRGGATSKKECSYSFYSDSPTNVLSSTQANFKAYFNSNDPPGKNLERTTRVGSYYPNRLGLYDMHGNVWEWCQNFTDDDCDTHRVRGGSWEDGAGGCESSGRYGLGFGPRYRRNSVGFRVALIPVEYEEYNPPKRWWQQ